MHRSLGAYPAIKPANRPPSSSVSAVFENVSDQHRADVEFEESAREARAEIALSPDLGRMERAIGNIVEEAWRRG